MLCQRRPATPGTLRHLCDDLELRCTLTSAALRYMGEAAVDDTSSPELRSGAFTCLLSIVDALNAYVALRLRAGQVNINGAAPDFMAPFGGYKQSGNGREWGDHAFTEFLEVKAVLGWSQAQAAE